MDRTESLGSWAFIVGLVIALIAGFVTSGNATVTWVLAVLGLIVGLINVTHSETQLYLVAAIAFLVSASSLTLILSSLENILTNVIVFVAPSAAIVAVRALYDIARSR